MGRLARPILAVSACGDKQKEPQGLPHGSPQVDEGNKKAVGLRPRPSVFCLSVF